MGEVMGVPVLNYHTFFHKTPSTKKLYWHNPTYPENTPDAGYIYFLRYRLLEIAITISNDFNRNRYIDTKILLLCSIVLFIAIVLRSFYYCSFFH